MESPQQSAPAAGLSGQFSHSRSELLRFLTARCGSRDAAEDLLQELWLKISTQVTRPIGNARGYLFRMANNLVLDELRGRQRAMARDRHWLEAEGGGSSPIDMRPDPAPPADEALARKEEARLLESAVASLPPGAQRALRLHRFDGLPQSEVAQIMGISRSGVEKHLAVAMKHLRNALADCGFFDAAASNRQGDTGGGRPRLEHEP